MEPIHLSSTPYIRGSFPVMWLLMKRLKRRLGALEKRMLQCASRIMHGWNAGRCECDTKEGMVMLFVHRETTPSYRLDSRKVSLDPFHESAGLLTHLLGQMPSYNTWQGIETTQWQRHGGQGASEHDAVLEAGRRHGICKLYPE